MGRKENINHVSFWMQQRLNLYNQCCNTFCKHKSFLLDDYKLHPLMKHINAPPSNDCFYELFTLYYPILSILFCLFCSRISSKDYTFIKNDILYPVDMIILDVTTIKIWMYDSPYLYRIYMAAFLKINKQISRPESSYKNKKKIFHMISSTFNFEEMCFDRFLHFIFYRFRSFIVIMIIEGWDAVMWKTSPSTNGWFMHVYHTCCITTYSSFSSPSFYFC